MKEKLQSLKEMIIIRSKTFSLSDRIQNAKNIYNTKLEIYEKDRKDPNAFSNKSEKEENDELKSSKSRKILDKINSISKKKLIQKFNNSSTNISLLNSIAQQQAWQAHVDAINSHSIATMGIPIM